MSRSLNKVQLIGNVGRDPEIRSTKDGSPIANMSIATSDTWKDKQGQKQEKTEWHRVVVFGKLAEIVQQYVNKGDKLFLEGKLQTKKWTDKNGQDRYTTEIVLDSFGGQMIMLGSQGRGNQQAQQNDQSPPQQDPQGVDDDIPF